MRLSLRVKVLLFVTAVVIAIGSASAYVVVKEQAHNRERKLVARGTALAFALSKSAAEGLAREDLDIHKVASYIEAGDVLFAQVFLDIWESADAYPIGKLKEPPNPDAARHFMTSNMPFYSKSGTGFDFYQPIFMNEFSPPLTIGFARVKLSDDYIHHDIRGQLRSSAAVSVGLTLAAIIVINAVMGGFIVRPVLSLKRAAARFRDEGILPEPVSGRFEDEITDLSVEFGRLCASVKEKEGALRERSEVLAMKNDELSLLHEISSAASRTVDIKGINSSVIDAIMKSEAISHARQAGIFVVEGEDMRLIPQPGHSAEFLKLHECMKVGDCLCGIAARTGELIVSSDCSSDGRHTLKRSGISSHGHIIVPLKAGRKVTGVLYLYRSVAFEADEDTLRLLSNIGNQIGMAIHNAGLYQEVKELSLHDPLTGLANRRLMKIVLGKCFARCKRFGSPLSVVMMDLDHFKRYNDEHGHAAGDRLLVDVASAMAKEIREVDLAVRYGGEEFLMLLSESDEDGGYKVAEKIRSNIASRCGITASAGVAAYEPWMKDKEDLIEAADRALYRAKETGRDRTLCGKNMPLR